MPRRWTPLLPCALAAALACGDAGVEPDPADEPLRTLLVHHQDTGENLLWDTDGTPAGELAPGTRGMVPIGAHAGEGAVALLDGSALVLTTLSNPGLIDTIIQPTPASQSLATFSTSGLYVAIVSYAPTPALLLYDRANRRVDTLSLAGANPVLPPMFSPDDERIALVTLTDLSILVTIIPRAGFSGPTTHPLAVSRFLNRLVFGWPRWGSDGLRLAVRRVAEDGPDTLVVGIVDPEGEGSLLDEEYRVLMAPAGDPDGEVGLVATSTYALTTDGSALALGAVPASGADHAIYLVSALDGRVRPISSDIGQFPVLPLFIRE